MPDLVVIGGRPVAGHWVVIPNEGIAELLLDSLNPTGPRPGWQLLLLRADPTQRPDLTLSMLVEASFQGYARRALGRAAWGAPVVADGCAVSTWGTAPLTWTSAGPTQTIYGAAVWDNTAGKLRRVERFDNADVVVLAAGQTLTFTPRWSRTSAEC